MLEVLLTSPNLLVDQAGYLGGKQFGRGGFLNNNDIMRFGWSTHKGQKTFRIAVGKNGTKWHKELIFFKGHY